MKIQIANGSIVEIEVKISASESGYGAEIRMPYPLDGVYDDIFVLRDTRLAAKRAALKEFRTELCAA